MSSSDVAGACLHGVESTALSGSVPSSEISAPPGLQKLNMRQLLQVLEEDLVGAAGQPIDVAERAERLRTERHVYAARKLWQCLHERVERIERVLQGRPDSPSLRAVLGSSRLRCPHMLLPSLLFWGGDVALNLALNVHMAVTPRLRDQQLTVVVLML